MVEKVRKRDGSIVDFNPQKIEEAIWKAAVSVGGQDKEKASAIAKKVEKRWRRSSTAKPHPWRTCRTRLRRCS